MQSYFTSQEFTSQETEGQRGIALVMLAISIVAILALVTFVVEVGNIYRTRSKFQIAVDASSLRAATIFKQENQGIADNGQDPITYVTSETKKFLKLNLLLSGFSEQLVDRVFPPQHPENDTINVDLYVREIDGTPTRQISVSGTLPYPISILKLFGPQLSEVNLSAAATASYDDVIAIALIDASASMNFDISFPIYPMGVPSPTPTISPAPSPTPFDPPAVLMKKTQAAYNTIDAIIDLAGSDDYVGFVFYNNSNSPQRIAPTRIPLAGIQAEATRQALKAAAAQQIANLCPEPSGNCSGETNLAAAIDAAAEMMSGIDYFETFRKVVFIVAGGPATSGDVFLNPPCGSFAPPGHEGQKLSLSILNRADYSLRRGNSALTGYPIFPGNAFVYTLGLGDALCTDNSSSYQIGCDQNSNKIRAMYLRRLANDQAAMVSNNDPGFKCALSRDNIAGDPQGIFAPSFSYWPIRRMMVKAFKNNRAKLTG